MFQIMAEPDIIFFDMMEVQLEVEVTAPDPPQQQPVPAGPFLALALTANISLSAVLTAEPALTSTAIACLSAAKSQGTVKVYTSVVNHFQAFCLLEGHSFPHFNTEAVTQFALRRAARKTGRSFLSRIKPALVYLEAAPWGDPPVSLLPQISFSRALSDRPGPDPALQRRPRPCHPLS
jgi:hypothetical protein